MTCPTCLGTGHILATAGDRFISVTVACCTRCRGMGTVEGDEDQAFTVTPVIEAGISNTNH